MKYLNKSFIVSMSIDSQKKWDSIFVKIKENDEQVKDDKQINNTSKK